MRRAISWKYQYDLVRATPRPKHWIELRFEDLVQRQDETIARLESCLGVKLARIPVKPEAVGRWKTDTGPNYYDFLAPAMERHGYEMPPLAAEACYATNSKTQRDTIWTLRSAPSPIRFGWIRQG